MEYNYPKFTPEMKKTHTILDPQHGRYPVPACWSTHCAATATSANCWATAAVPWHSWG